MVLFSWGLVSKTKLLFMPKGTIGLHETQANCLTALEETKKHSIFSKEPGERAWLWMCIAINIGDGIPVIYC